MPVPQALKVRPPVVDDERGPLDLRDDSRPGVGEADQRSAGRARPQVLRLHPRIRSPVINDPSGRADVDVQGCRPGAGRGAEEGEGDAG
eukprot:CAMPEP_0182481648 /NCGR_PEP_ID=MMETSP1319-20130603/37693_1 /TAXON_ID=172717 /ORGANISM="Bolidomonas pacifica, Strain RCC208" /LENGTH=88 /DNA_ID=CAMNT_0024683277 /DNA_START=150 /DNA_END=416 /DNA_ORIENTATION=+